MFHTMLQDCKKEKLIEDGDLVLAGVSGGADSVCLLLLLKELQKEITFTLEVVHVEHGIRGEESEADAAFVEKLCTHLHVPVHVYHVQAAKYAKEQKLGLEEAARILRYDCYQQVAKICQGVTALQTPVKVALAHHADDNAETVLFQMIRGCGIDGLVGMQPKRILAEGVEVVRPLLGVTRKQIEEYLAMSGQVYQMDSTNTELVYSRNKIRNEVLPALETINTQAVSHINQSAAYLRELGMFLQMQVQNAAREVFREEKDALVIQMQPLLELPTILQKEILHLALTKAAGAAKDIRANHVEYLAELFTLQVGRSISLPYGICAKRVYEGVMLCKGKSAEEESFFFEIDKGALTKHLAAGCYEVAVADGVLTFQLVEALEEISKNTYTKCFDYDKIKGSFQIRTRRAGDYLIIDENGHKKRLKEYFINEKISQETRDKMLLLTEDSKVIWAIGGRISADVKITEQTRRILKVQITGGSYYEN